MAEGLRRLSQAHDAHMARTDSPSHQQEPGTPHDDQRSEIYHSLEDAVPISAGPATPASPASLSLLNAATAGNPPMTGQVCRYAPQRAGSS